MLDFRPTGVQNRFTELRNSKVKYKHIFYKASSPPSPSSLLKLPNNSNPALVSRNKKQRNYVAQVLTVNLFMNYFSGSNEYYADDNIAADGRSLSLLGTLRKTRRQRHQTIGLKSKTIAVHVRYNSGTFLCRPLQNSNVK